MCRASSGSPVNEERAWCSGQDRLLFLHPRVSYYLLDLVGFIVTQKWAAGALCGPQSLILGVWFKGRDVWCRDCTYWQLLAGLQAISILANFRHWKPPCLTSACSQTPSPQSSRLPQQTRLPCCGSLHSICKPRWRVCFLTGGAVLGALGRAPFWVQFAHISFLLFVVFEKLKQLSAPCPGTCLISWFITGDGSAGPESNVVKRCGVHLCGRGTCSVYKLVSWWGRCLTELGAGLLWAGCLARTHHLQEQKGVPASDFGQDSLLSKSQLHHL